MADKAKTKKEAPSFEEAMEQLDQIVSDLESGKMPLGDLVSAYEKGSELLKTCQSELDAARGRVQALSPDSPSPASPDEEAGADVTADAGVTDPSTPSDHELF